MSVRARNLCRYVIPTILSSVCFFLFTIIDGIFVGHGVGTNGLGAINIAFPFVMVVSAVFMLTTIGGVTIVAIRLGRGDHNGAIQAFMHAIIGTVIFAVVLCILGTFFAEQVANLLGANDTFRKMATDYLFWYSVFIIPSALSSALQGFCRNDGSPVLVSAAVIIGTCCNIFGDWLCIFPLQLGLKGAAIATGVSQVITLAIVSIHFIRKKGSLRFVAVKFSGPLCRKILTRGLPESISQLATPVATLCMNYVLLAKIGDIAVNAFSVIAYVASFSVAIFFGTAQGLQPMFGRCYGAKNTSDLKFYFRAGILINFIGSLAINVLLLFIGGPVCALFGVDSATLDYTVSHMPLYAWGFTVMSLNTIISAYLYSTKRSKQAIIINTLRSLVASSLITVLLPAVFGASIVWHTFGIYELVVLTAAIFLTRCSEKNGIIYR